MAEECPADDLSEPNSPKQKAEGTQARRRGRGPRRRRGRESQRSPDPHRLAGIEQTASSRPESFTELCTADDLQKQRTEGTQAHRRGRGPRRRSRRESQRSHDLQRLAGVDRFEQTASSIPGSSTEMCTADDLSEPNSPKQKAEGAQAHRRGRGPRRSSRRGSHDPQKLAGIEQTASSRPDSHTEMTSLPNSAIDSVFVKHPMETAEFSDKEKSLTTKSTGPHRHRYRPKACDVLLEKQAKSVFKKHSGPQMQPGASTSQGVKTGCSGKAPTGTTCQIEASSSKVSEQAGTSNPSSKRPGECKGIFPENQDTAAIPYPKAQTFYRNGKTVYHSKKPVSKGDSTAKGASANSPKSTQHSSIKKKQLASNSVPKLQPLEVHSGAVPSSSIVSLSQTSTTSKEDTCTSATSGASLISSMEELSLKDTSAEPSPEQLQVQAQKAMNCLIEDLESKCEACMKQCHQEVSKLRGTLKKNKLITTLDSLQDDLIQWERGPDMIQASINEAESWKEVFLLYYRETMVALEELSTSGNFFPETISSFSRSFVREVKRCDKRLPIYAHRIDIMKMVGQSQVSIVIGETGSGKSTQLVQYLYEAQYSSNGLIACTQPRKLAAISLAEHVSKEVNEVVGETYGYISARNSKLSDTTGVVYMTDHTLLNQCIADPNLSKYSCLVIDEAHERSIHTDILIAFIKRCLPNRPDLKVIITSATINPTIFSRYFGGEEKCPIIKVPGRVFPVKIHWGEPLAIDQDYVAEAVQKVHEIHVGGKNDSGDILVFLTCPAEIERACKLAQQTLKNEAVVLPLHGKLQPEDQQKIFNTTSKKRKVVFSTNIAETSVTIPGIVYVIDTGLSKEMCYDSQKNMNSLEIRPISKSSADQRKGRAGRTCPGECYRLYSEADYAGMRDDSTPEILRITLAFAVIKLYEFGIKDIGSFEFVESPDRKALDDAIDNLKFLGAINGNNLTKLGKKMALLPLDPNLSKVLLDGTSKGVGIEAAVAVAISSLAGRVFFRPASDKLQEESDAKKLAFCQQSGDQMTYLHTFFQWSLQKKKDQTKWCVENFVNAKSMRMVQQIVEELRFILQKYRISIRSHITSLNKADKLLPKLFFDAFLRNICVHLGHNAVGYWSERLPEEQLVIYPASSLKHLSSTPQCVVYEKTQKTSQHFLLQALPVQEEWIQEAIDAGKLASHPAVNPFFTFYQVCPLSFNSLGPRLMLKLNQKYPYDRRRMVPDFSNFDIQPVFEHLNDQGTLRVFAQEQNHGKILESVTGYIKTCQEELKEESFTCGLTSNTDDVQMTIGLGGCIQCVLMPGDLQTIVVRGLCFDDDISKAKHELSSYGKCTSRISRYQRNTQLFLRFQNPANAEKALKHSFVSIEDPDVKIQSYREQSRNHFRLKIEWWRRERLDFAYINFDEDDFLECFSGRQPRIFDIESGLSFCIQHKSYSVRVTGVQSSTTEELVESRMHELFPPCQNFDLKIKFFFSDPFEETHETYTRQRDRLLAHLSECAPQSEYYVNFCRTDKRHISYRAFVYFNDTALCWRMFRHMSAKRLHGDEIENEDADSAEERETSDSSDNENNPYFCEYRGCSDSNGDSDCSDSNSDSGCSDSNSDSGCSDSDSNESDSGEAMYRVEMSLSSSTRYTKKIFNVIKPSVEEISHFFSSVSLSCSVEYCNKDRWGNTFVNITSSSLSAFTEAKKELSTAVQPDKIVFKDLKKSQYVSTLSFQRTIEDIQTKTSTYIKISGSSMSTSSIEVYGTKENRETAKKEIELHLQSVLQGEMDCFEIDLKQYGPGLMKHLVEKYGCNAVALLSTKNGISATKLNPRKQVLTLFANEVGHKYVLNLLANFKPGSITQQVQPPSKTDLIAECCVCFDSHDAKQKKTFYYRLESCGHIYCKDCIEQQLEPSSIDFPVKCVADDCESELVWRDFENLFKHKVKTLRDITSASLKSYAAINSKTISNCITPDCDMLFVKSEYGKRFVCGHCGESMCTKCCTPWHEGFDSCGMFMAQGMGDDELDKWMKERPSDRKRCPNCSAPIEKIEGCNHMTCSQCKSHICWVCLKFFDTSGKCYGHLHRNHGSYV